MSKVKAWRGGMDQGIALSISGGVDYMALAYLVSRWPEEHAPSTCIAVVVVDHGLRDESAEEARLTAEKLHDLGSPFEAVARTARRLALLHLLRSHHLQTILFGHHADDQCETAVLRAMNGSCDVEQGLDGLGGMRMVDGFGAHALLASLEKGHGRVAMTTFDQGIAIGRPLLSFPKVRILATPSNLSRRRAEDPTNEVTDQNVRNLVRALIRRVEQGSDLAAPTEINSDVSRALASCVHQAKATATAARPPLEALRLWVRSISDRRDDAEQRVTQLFAKAVMKSGDHGEVLQVRVDRIPLDTSDGDLKQLLWAVVNAASPLPLGSAAARGVGQGSDSPTSPDVLVGTWLRHEAVVELSRKAAVRSKPARTAVNGDVLLTVRKVPVAPQCSPSTPFSSTSSSQAVV
ncbi:hypothetical protein A4X13_0g8562 [Tilletia indica]|uniref:tRNA(Ile)-lysidine synthetase n=1 Tax=Tilletia indica TaxID=43049 RepID=A0A8T8SE07_9BASI|nr:hypothetical protein A4X13_0g8562 [Tilletia indica]